MFALPGYTITAKVCENNRWKVYRAQRIKDRSLVIIKVLQREANAADIAKLTNEYEITRNLDIEGIMKPVQLVWAGLNVALIIEDDGYLPLRQYRRTGQPDMAFFFSLAMQLTEILGKFHQNSLMHGNLKPEDIFIHPETERVKLVDCGTATRVFPNSQNKMVPNHLTGNPAYMSPEQIGRMDKVVDQRSDFYALGIVCYEMFTGQLPYQADDHIDWVAAHLCKKPIYPGKINPDIPPAISALIMKLLAKNAGERYQSASEFMADLKECQRQWSQGRVIEPFALGQSNRGRFQLSRKMYGREKEVAILTAAFSRACSGHPAVLLVHGSAGSGKTVLIQDTLRPLAEKRGYFITGKFDQLQRNIPYVPFVQAFGDVMRQFLTENEESLVEWKKKLRHAVGRSAPLITSIIPGLALLIGVQPTGEGFPSRESQNCFRMVLRNIIQALANEQHPLVILLDDLQWADPASLELLQYLCENLSCEHLLLVGAYRDDEVNGKHQLLGVLENLQIAGVAMQYVPLAPLSPNHTYKFVADSLHSPELQSRDLASILHRKTGGNPFFLGQLLQAAYTQDILRFSMQDDCWKWDAVSLEEMAMTDDVVNLVLSKLQKLPDKTLRILKLAACLGNTFDIHEISIVCEQQSFVQTAVDLWPSIVEGFVLPIHDDSHFDKAWRNSSKAIFGIDFAVRYEFLHDRVQQAAYALIPEPGKNAVHLEIGRLIMQNTSTDEQDEKIIGIMDHVNRGLALIKDAAEKIKFAKYNLLAGRKIKASTACGLALSYFRFGLGLLPDNACLRSLC